VETLAAKDVASIEIIYGNLPAGFPDTVEVFQAAPEDFERLLALLRGGERARQPVPSMPGLGRIRIRLHSGEEFVADLCHTGGGPVAYHIGQSTYWGGSDKEFIRTLIECKNHAQEKTRTLPAN